MSAASKNKIRLLYLIDILEQRTDEEHVLNALELIDLLALQGITVDRKSIYSDIDALQNYGYDIIMSHSPRGYYMASREFELAEVRLLSDAVQAANFISQNKTKKLLAKIEKLASSHQADVLREQVYVDSRPKCTNEEIYYNIDTINNAIKSGKQISFTYQRRKIMEKFTARHSDKLFPAFNPYSMIWSNDHYYLVGNNPKYDNLMHARIDRMKKVSILDTDARPFSEVSEYTRKFNAAEYSKNHINMFSGEMQQIELVCHNSIVEEILDRFGANTPIKTSDDENHFTVMINVAVSDGLVAWILQFGSKIFVKSPNNLKKLVENRCREIIDMYK